MVKSSSTLLHHIDD